MSLMTKHSVVRLGLNTLRLTWKMVFSRGLPLATSRPMSWHHMFTRRTSATAIANSAVCFSNAASASPRSRPSVPSRSMTSVGNEPDEEPLPEEAFGVPMATQTPLVVCDRPSSWFISWNDVPKTWFMSVDLPLLWGPMMATTWYARFHSPAPTPARYRSNASAPRAPSCVTSW